MADRGEDWSTIVFRAGVVAAMQPVEYAKTLIQLGYEPIPPKPTTTFFGKPALGLPSVFQYIGYIRGRDGFLGCYRGLGARICASVVNAMVYSTVSECIVFESDRKNKKKTKNEDSDDEDEEETVMHMACEMIRNICSHGASVIASQPFHVIAVRMMSQFIGQESKYTGLFASARDIFNEGGIAGFYKGLVPRLTGEFVAIIVASTFSFTLNAYVVSDPRSKGFVKAACGFLASTVTYPFHVVSACMTVNGSTLAAGNPPYMPVYTDWTDCWAHLVRHNQSKRGSSLIWRYYTGTTTVPLIRSNFALTQFKLPSASE